MKIPIFRVLNYVIKTRRTFWFTATSKTKARYARTSLGSFWLGISTLLTVLCLGSIYGRVFNVVDFALFLTFAPGRLSVSRHPTPHDRNKLF